MKLLNILSSPWAIDPAKLNEIQGIYETHLRGDKIDIAGVEQRLGRPLANSQKTYDVINGVAVIAIEGVMARKMNLFSQISGGSSTQIIQQSLEAALADSQVHSIILAIDSPGGTVDGTQTLGDAVYAARDVKPIVTLASGQMESAGYWVGSAASQVYITELTTLVGSIGVVTAHKDVSAQEASQGIKTTEITAGKYKRIASQYAPLSADGLQSIQDRLDYTYSVFVDAVARNRGVSTEKVLSDMADGRTFVGQQAIDAGLVDGVSTLDALVAKLNADRTTPASSTKRAGVAQPTQPIKGKTMQTAAEFAQAFPEEAASLRAEGAAAERARIQAVEGIAVPGHAELVNRMKFDGASTSADVALAILNAEKQTRAQAAADIAADAPNPVEQTPSSVEQADASSDSAQSKDALVAKAKEYQKEHPEASFIAAYKAVGGK